MFARLWRSAPRRTTIVATAAFTASATSCSAAPLVFDTCEQFTLSSDGEQYRVMVSLPLSCALAGLDPTHCSFCITLHKRP